jgi:hypothetical protein
MSFPAVGSFFGMLAVQVAQGTADLIKWDTDRLPWALADSL